MSDEIKDLVNMPDSKIDTSDIPEVADWSSATRGKFYRIKTAFWADPMGSCGRTPEEEMADERQHLEEELGVKLDVHMPYHAGQIEEGTDLVLFDYGGMMMGSSLCEDNSRTLIRWAEDHPSALVIIVSTFTYDNIFRYEIEEHLGLDQGIPYHYNMPKGKRHTTPIHNIVVEEWDENFIPDWFRTAHGCKPYEGIPPYSDEVTKLEEPEPQITTPEDEDFLREEEKKVFRKPKIDAKTADAVFENQKRDPERQMRVQATLAAMNARAFASLSLPDQTFFQPKKEFLAYMKKHFRSRFVYDVGAGKGHVTKALRKAGLKHLRPIDLNPRDGALVPIAHADATDYPFKSGSLVMLCRPCHGSFVYDTITRALGRKADVMYVGLTKNVKADLGDYYRKFKKVAKSVGEDGEHIWVYQGR